MYAFFQPFAFNLLAYKNKNFFSKQNDSKIAVFGIGNFNKDLSFALSDD